MASRLASLDREYYRQLSWTLPVAGALIAAVFYIVPGIETNPEMARRTVGRQGPLRVMPQIDIVTDEPEESHLTAAPRASFPSDFVAVEIDYAIRADAPKRPAPTPRQNQKRETERIFSNQDDVQDALRTTSLPVLADVDYQLIYMERPVYPRAAVRAGEEGDVDIMMLIDSRGRVAQAVVLNPKRHPLLEEAAKAAVVHSLFRPYVVKGKPTPFWVRVPFEFRLLN